MTGSNSGGGGGGGVGGTGSGPGGAGGIGIGSGLYCCNKWRPAGSNICIIVSEVTSITGLG